VTRFAIRTYPRRPERRLLSAAVRALTLAALAAAATGASLTAGAQNRDTARAGSPDRLSVDRIYRAGEFRSAPLPSSVWFREGTRFIDVRPNPGGGVDLVQVDAATRRATPIVEAQQLLGGQGKRLDVEEVQLSADGTKALLYHSSVRVWRRNTRGRYDMLDLSTRKLTPVSRRPGLQMFAKFSPDSRRVAFVRDNDLWVTNLQTGAETQLTRDGSETIINGTTDWVYEEELGLSDAYRWSPDGRAIAFWRFDQSPIRTFPLVNELELYPQVMPLRYPKAGTPNSRVKLGVVSVAPPGRVTWLDVGDGNDQYLARMEWVGDDSLVVQRMPRRQNRVDVIMASARTGGTRAIFADRDSAYVDVENGDMNWLQNQRQFLWLSDRTGWRQLFLYDRTGSAIRQVTRDGMDVLGVVSVDEARGHVYVNAAAPTPRERNVYRFRLDGTGAGERVTQGAGTHAMTVLPDRRTALDYHSTINSPVTVTEYDFPAMTMRRVVVDNAELKRKLEGLRMRPAEFITVPMADGTVLDGWRIAPPDFEVTRRYPVLMFVYGGPAAPQVSDAYTGSAYLWHQMLAQHGYVVISVDNRGAAWRGREFRKVTQYRLGVHESNDQLEVARWLGRQSWADPARIGIWGWSYGGYLAAMTSFRGGNLFRMAISVAPVSDWRLYDTIYTERFMWTPQDNAKGYDESAPQSYVNGLTARYLVVHGTGDDNVHPQNTLQLVHKLAGAGKLFQMLLYPNRTHSISEDGVTPQLRESLARFILDNL
jgi:dipeptidyl-peptidase-4